MAGMLAQLAPRGVSHRTVLLDGWYAATALLKWLLAAGKTFYCPLKSKRVVDDLAVRAWTRLKQAASQTE